MLRRETAERAHRDADINSVSTQFLGAVVGILDAGGRQTVA
jgi:hypothetical protein